VSSAALRARLSLADQVERRDYGPPTRARIVSWQHQQHFPICPHIDDPDEANVYRDLAFPEGVYERIEAYHEQKAEASADEDHALR